MKKQEPKYTSCKLLSKFESHSIYYIWIINLSLSLHLTFWVLMFLLILTHLAHISSFYSIKTYNDTLDLKAVRSNFVNVTEQTKPVIIAEVKFEIVYLNRLILLRGGGIAMSRPSINSISMEIIAI